MNFKDSMKYMLLIPQWGGIPQYVRIQVIPSIKIVRENVQQFLLLPFLFWSKPLTKN